MRADVEQEDDGRWIAEVSALPGAMAYGTSKAEAVAKVEALVLRILADRIEHGEATPGLDRVSPGEQASGSLEGRRHGERKHHGRLA